jgi:tetratricopeptide (TPR) repeat protein
MEATTGQDLRAGIQLYMNQDYVGAEALLSDAVKIRYDWAEGWSYLGYSQYMQQKYTEAAASLEKAVMMDQENPEARFGLGLVWAATKRVDAAIACWNETLRIKPDHADAKRSLVGGLIFRANAYLAEKDYDHAESDLERAIKIDRTASQPVVILANHFADQNMTARAEKVVKEALAFLPNDGQIQALAIKLKVEADKDTQVVAANTQAKQQVQKSQEVPCPNCKKPVMEWAAICPHCNTQIKAIPSLFATRNAETPAYRWQDVMYYITTVIWILFGAIPLALIAFALFAVGNKMDQLGGPATGLAGLAMIPITFASARILLGVGLLFQNDWCMSIAKWVCIIFILKNLLWIMLDFYGKQYFSLAMDIFSIGLDGFLIYLLNYMGCD